MPSFPKLANGHVAKFPLTRRHTFRTTVLASVDASEQRFSKGSPLESFTLKFTDISTVDKNVVRDFFNARQGAFDTAWDFTLEIPIGAMTPTIWSHLQFVPNQTFTAAQTIPNRWSFSLQFRQTRKN